MATHPWFSTHTHSVYSTNDAMARIPDIVAKVARLKQPGIGITDHGVMGGAFELYKAARSHGVVPFPGIEAYQVDSVPRVREAKSNERYHLGLLALDLDGYKALVRLTTRSHTAERFYRKPLIDYEDLAALHESGASKHIACLSGCFFGLLCQTLVYRGTKPALQVARMLASWFPHFFIEIQNHNIDRPGELSDPELAMELYSIANKLGLPVITTQDAHYLEAAHQGPHGTMKALAYGSLEGEDEFPGDGYHVASTKHVSNHYTGELRPIWETAKASYQHLLGLNTLRIPHLDTYKFLMPTVANDPGQELTKAVRSALVSRGVDPQWNETQGGPLGQYAVVAREELDVIISTGFAAYFLMVADICKWASGKGIRVQTRGSANGSLVCHLIGISHIDPIKWGLSMGGFLTKDRSKPPDIDLDCQQLRRAEVIAYVQHRFPCVQQSTPSSWGWDEETGTGSLFVQYLNAQRRALPPAEFKARWPDTEQPAAVIRRQEPELYERLRVINDIRPWKAVGAHAAGFVLDSPEFPLADYVPMLRIASSDRTVTGMPMDPLEDAGYVKLDILGLRTLESVDRCLHLIGKTWDDLEKLEPNDKKVFADIGRTQPANGTFQLEGYSVSKGVRRLQPVTIGEVIDAVALFRPGVSEEAVDNYLRNRRKGVVPKFHPLVDPVLSPTWGEFIYTEQVLRIARLIGMSSEEVQSLLKAMKVKHGKAGYNADSERRFNEAQDRFVSACVEAGISTGKAGELWERIYGFNRYAFKAAHATPYGLLAYWTAWLRRYYPAEFYVSVLDVINEVKPQDLHKYEIAARQRGVRILPPKVGLSGASWTLEGQSVRRGLASIKGVGLAAAQDIANNGPYSSWQDIKAKCSSRLVTGFKAWESADRTFNGVMAKLQAAGALEEIGIGKTDKRPTFSLRLKKV